MSRPEVLSRVQQVLRMREPVLVARQLAARLVDDAPAPTPVGDLVDGIGELEAALAEANVIGVVHCSPYLAPHLVSHVLVSRSGVGFMTPSGHALVVDGGYRPVLGDGLLVATSALYGWRVPVEVRETVDAENNEFIAIAERSVVVGYEQAVGAVTVAEVGS